MGQLPSPTFTNTQVPVPKRWPTEYYVAEINEGFDAMSQLALREPSLRQKAIFERTFPPNRYVKSTFGRAKLHWKKASQEDKEHFLALPRTDPRARWTHFVHHVEGKTKVDFGDITNEPNAVQPQGEPNTMSPQLTSTANDVLTFDPRQSKCSYSNPSSVIFKLLTSCRPISSIACKLAPQRQSLTYQRPPLELIAS